MRCMLAAMAAVVGGILAGCSGGSDGAHVPAGATGKIEGYVYAGAATRGAVEGGRLAVRASRVPIGMAAVAGATVRIPQLQLSTVTQADGYFVLEHVAAGSHQVMIAHPGYRDPIALIVNVIEGTTVALETGLGVGYYICAGVGDYTYLPPDADLAGPPNDVRAMANALFHSFYGNGVMLIDGAADKGEIKQAILDAARKMTEEDFLIFYFSGHGASFRMAEGWIDAFCPADYRDDDLTTFVRDSELRDWLQATPNPRRCVVILDTCYSGSFFDGVSSIPTAKGGLVVPRALQQVGCTVLSASAAAELSVEINAQGLFTRYLSWGLGREKEVADVNGDREITAQELYNYAAPRATQIYPQHPQLQVGENPVLLRY